MVMLVGVIGNLVLLSNVLRLISEILLSNVKFQTLNPPPSRTRWDSISSFFRQYIWDLLPFLCILTAPFSIQY